MSTRLRTSESKRTDGKGGLEGMRKRMKDLGLTRVKVGVPGDLDSDVDVSDSLAKQARVHEFGSLDGVIPERSFLRAGITTNRKSHLSLARRGAKKVLEGSKTAEQILGLIGMKASSDIKEYMVAAEFTPLAPRTIARKGSDKPLIDTGQLRQSVTYVLEEVG